MLLFTLLEKGGLNHIIFCFLVFFLVFGSIKFNASRKPFSFKASLYGFNDSSKISSLDDDSDIRFAIDFGNCWRIVPITSAAKLKKDKVRNELIQAFS